MRVWTMTDKKSGQIVGASAGDLSFLLPIPEDHVLSALVGPVTLGTYRERYPIHYDLSDVSIMDLTVLAGSGAKVSLALRSAAERELTLRGCAQDTEGRWLMPGWESVPIVEPRR